MWRDNEYCEEKCKGSDKKPIVLKTNNRRKRKYMASFKRSKPYDIK